MSGLAAFLQEQFWAITPERFAVLSAAFEGIEAGRYAFDSKASKVEASEYSIERGELRRAALGAPRGARQAKSVLVLPIVGTIYPRLAGADPLSGGCNLQETMAVLRRAVDDPHIASVILDFDSPGGMVSGVPEAARVIRSLRGRKPLTAVVNFQAASAAYYLAAQADEIVASPSATLGSVGVIATYLSAEKRIADQGYRVQTLRWPALKGEADGVRPLTDEALAHRMAQIRKIYDAFETDIALGLGIDRSTVARSFGQGRSFDAEQAVACGMAARILSFDGVLAEHASGRAEKQRAFRRSQGRAGMLDELPPLTSDSYGALNRVGSQIEALRAADAKAQQGRLAARWGIVQH